MPRKQLIIPHYCKRCGHLTFVIREGEPFQFRLLDFCQQNWKPHSCAQIEPDLVTQIAGMDAYRQIQWHTHHIDFQHQAATPIRKRPALSIGVVLNISQESNTMTARVLTPENQMFEVRIPHPEKAVTAGKALALKKAVRIGKEKYRLEKLEYRNPGSSIKSSKTRTDPFFHLILQSRDQEKLETFINRLVNVCNNNRILPVNTIPLPIEENEGEQTFRREIHLPLASDLLQQIEKLTVPESVEISMRHG